MWGHGAPVLAHRRHSPKCGNVSRHISKTFSNSFCYSESLERPSHVMRASRRRHSDGDVTKPPRRWLKVRRPTKPARRIRLTSQGHYTDYPDVTEAPKSSKSVKPTPVAVMGELHNRKSLIFCQ